MERLKEQSFFFEEELDNTGQLKRAGLLLRRGLWIGRLGAGLLFGADEAVGFGLLSSGKFLVSGPWLKGGLKSSGMSGENLEGLMTNTGWTS